MLIRKNQSTPSEYHKLIRQTQYEQQSGASSNISEENSDYRTFDAEDLVQKIKEQQGKIKKLLSIIDKYKSKIEEFQQYEQVIKEFLARKYEQKQLVRRKHDEKVLSFSKVSQKSKIQTEPCKRLNKQLIVPSYSISILCQKQKFHYQKFASIKYESGNRSSLIEMGSSSDKEQQKQNRQYITNYKDKNERDPYYKKNKMLGRSNSTFGIDHSVLHLDNSECQHENNRRSVIQRVPSLNNMRRIQKCFKLLKS